MDTCEWNVINLIRKRPTSCAEKSLRELVAYDTNYDHYTLKIWLLDVLKGCYVIPKTPKNPWITENPIQKQTNSGYAVYQAKLSWNSAENLSETILLSVSFFKW